MERVVNIIGLGASASKTSDTGENWGLCHAYKHKLKMNKLFFMDDFATIAKGDTFVPPTNYTFDKFINDNPNCEIIGKFDEKIVNNVTGKKLARINEYPLNRVLFLAPGVFFTSTIAYTICYAIVEGDIPWKVIDAEPDLYVKEAHKEPIITDMEKQYRINTIEDTDDFRFSLCKMLNNMLIIKNLDRLIADNKGLADIDVGDLNPETVHRNKEILASLCPSVVFEEVKKVDRIRLYGFEMWSGSDANEYEYQRPCVDFWLAYAMGRGIVVESMHYLIHTVQNNQNLYGYNKDELKQNKAR